MKKQCLGLLLLLLSSFAFARPNLLYNGDFEQTEHGLPRGWTTETYTNDPQGVLFSIGHEGAFSGKNYVIIENLKADDAKLVQNVRVTPDTVYKISCMVKVFGMGEKGLGANISLLDILAASADIRGTHNTWQKLELYGKTGPKQHTISLTLRVGGYGRMNTGKAFFDDVRMVKVEKPPPHVSVKSFWARPQKPNAEKKAAEKKQSYTMPVTVLFALLFLMMVYFVYRNGLRKRDTRRLREQEPRTEQLFLLTLVAGLVVRLFLAVSVEGFPSDIACFKSWAVSAFDKGLHGFYSQGMFVDYPPGYIYVLYLIGFLRSLFGLSYNSPLFLILIKLPSFITDLLMALLIYRFAQKRLGSLAAYALSLLFIFNPAVIHNSALFGQIDSFFTFFLVVSIYLLYRKKIEPAAVFYVIAVLIKPQALIFAPLGIYALVKLLVGSRNYRRFGITIVCLLGTLVAAALPFSFGGKGIVGLFDLYKDTLGSYSYATINAFNLYALLGGNWLKLNTPAFLFTPEIWGVIFITGIVTVSVLLCIRDFIKNKNPAFYFFMGLFLIAAVFVLGIKMHERYLYPAVPLSLFCYIACKDKRFLVLFAGFSATLLINQEMVLNFFLTTGSTFIPSGDVLLVITSIGNILLFLYLLWIGIDMFLRRPKRALRQKRRPRAGYAAGEREAGRSALIGPALSGPSDVPGYERTRYTKTDLILVGMLTLVYACVAFVNLGSFKAPQTYWRPLHSGEGFYADLGREKRIARVYYFFGLGAGSYTLEFSQDHKNWSAPVTISQPTRFDAVQWRFAALDLKARYLKVTAATPGVMLDELALFGRDSRKPLPIKKITPFAVNAAAGAGKDSGAAAVPGRTPQQGSPGNVFDEQDTIAHIPGYLDGFIFDEVYFARTGYENLLGIPPSETTHPPLGKLIISLGILLFGMVPWGWRFMGTLFGVLMVPLMYAFGKKLFGKTRAAFFTAFLFTFDFMHFVQTRIATIDVYAVFFIILMYYFMYDYFRMSFFKNPFRQTLRPLLFSGIFFGLGAACKWTALYGALGLAVIFFYTVWKRSREYAAARRVVKQASRTVLYPGSARVSVYQGKPVPQAESLVCLAVTRQFRPKLGRTLLWCVLFFIIIPAVIYFLAYLPIIAATAPPRPVSFVINDQVNMYNYHSKLVATHPFASSWWQWPFMVRPLWYYSGHQYLPPAVVSSIAAFGNPAVWWVGSLCLLAAVFIAIYKKDKRVLFIMIAFLSQYLPWIIIPRDLTFIYHFFTAVPFMVFCIVYVIMFILEKKPKARFGVYVYLALVLVLFIVFYPVLSGLPVLKTYAAFLRWFKSWVFYL